MIRKHEFKDIFLSDSAIICHQVNCLGVMGAGIAKQMKQKYPENFDYYKELCDEFSYRPELLLGQCQLTMNSDDTMPLPYTRYIANLFGQVGYGRDRQQTDLKALFQAFLSLREQSKLIDKFTIAIPYSIGCGLGGANWNDVYKIIEKVFKNDEYSIVDIYQLQK